jgi:hypothetical protein
MGIMANPATVSWEGFFRKEALWQSGLSENIFFPAERGDG